MKLLALLAFIFFLSCSALAEDIFVDVTKNGESSWKADFKVDGSACQFSQNKKSKTFSSLECVRLKNVLAKIKDLEIPKAPELVPRDAPIYQIRLGKKSFTTLLQAPEVCEVKSRTETKCRKVELTLAQKIILELMWLKATDSSSIN